MGMLSHKFRAKHVSHKTSPEAEEEERKRQERRRRDEKDLSERHREDEHKEKGGEEHHDPPQRHEREHGRSHIMHAARKLIHAATGSPEHERRLQELERKSAQNEAQRGDPPEGSGAFEHHLGGGVEVPLIIPLQGYRLLGTSNNLTRVHATSPEIEHFLLSGAQTVAAPAVGSTQTQNNGVIPNSVVIPPPGVGITKYAAVHVWFNTGYQFGGVTSVNLSWFAEFNNTQVSWGVTGVVSGVAGSIAEFIMLPWFLNGVEPRLNVLRVGALPTNGQAASITNPTNTPSAELYANAVSVGNPPNNVTLDSPDNVAMPFAFGGQGIAGQQMGVNLLTSSNPLVRNIFKSEHRAARWHAAQAR